MTMESTTPANFAKMSQSLADTTTDKAYAGIRGAQDSVKDAADKAAPLIRKAGDRAQSTMRQGFDAINDFAGQARDAATSATDSVVGYTKANPLKALAIAAASGALIYTAIRSLRTFRD
jgi:ElaB/YqjD/DUF883 family membrane-anchored ribosome-binding protein